MTPSISLLLAGLYNRWPVEIYIYIHTYIYIYIYIYIKREREREAPWSPVTYHIPDDENRDGLRNVGFLYTSDSAD
jgi:hypothetical protein